MKRAGWVLLSLGTGVATSATLANLSAAIGSAIGAGAIVATLVAILWYSWETHQLVKSQQRSAEISRHPWLAAADLKPEQVPPSDDVPFGAFDIWLPVTNRGSTPAYAVEIAAKWVAKDKDSYEEERGEASTQGAVVVPGDTLHFAVGRANLSGPHTIVEVDAEIRYQTADGTAGRLTVGFIYDRKGWRNRPGATYEFALTAGSGQPRRISA